MAVGYSPRIVTDGLVLCLDAADPKSYNGSGTNWVDRSGSGNNGTLLNGPTYSNGIFSFDDTNDAVSVNISLNSTYYSVEVWLNPSLVRNYNFQYGFSSPSGTGWGSFLSHTTTLGQVYIGTNVATRITPWASNVYELNKWHCFMWTFSNGTGKFYKNGELEAEKSGMTISSNFTSFFYGGQTQGSSVYGKSSQIRIYNRALTPDEIQQNYNATKGRFGL